MCFQDFFLFLGFLKRSGNARSTIAFLYPICQALNSWNKFNHSSIWYLSVHQIASYLLFYFLLFSFFVHIFLCFWDWNNLFFAFSKFQVVYLNATIANGKSVWKLERAFWCHFLNSLRLKLTVQLSWSEQSWNIRGPLNRVDL